jgi:hypothetical protein
VRDEDARTPKLLSDLSIVRGVSDNCNIRPRDPKCSGNLNAHINFTVTEIIERAVNPFKEMRNAVRFNGTFENRLR